MNFKQRYNNLKAKTLNDNSICNENQNWIKQVLEFFEKKGKRRNGIPVLDDGCYKTLCGYITRLKNVNKWFNNQPLKEMPNKVFIKEMTKVYEDLEEGRIKNIKGEIYKDRGGYYSKIFKGEPFRVIGKEEMVKKIIKYNSINETEVRFFDNFKEEIKKISNNVILENHKAFIWVLADFMENVGAILQTEKRDYRRQEDENGEPEYLLTLRKDILKRTRTPRTEISIFPETTEFLDIVLEKLKPNDKVFNFGIRQAEKLFDRAVKITKTKLISGEKPTLKDIRSSGACYLLNEGWTTDEIKSRLGHKPSSSILDKYVSYKALGKRKPKQKIYQGNLKKLQDELETLKQREKVKDKRMKELGEFLAKLGSELNEIKKAMK